MISEKKMTRKEKESTKAIMVKNQEGHTQQYRMVAIRHLACPLASTSHL
jgi:hypothetical protein